MQMTCLVVPRMRPHSAVELNTCPLKSCIPQRSPRTFTPVRLTGSSAEVAYETLMVGPSHIGRIAAEEPR